MKTVQKGLMVGLVVFVFGGCQGIWGGRTEMEGRDLAPPVRTDVQQDADVEVVEDMGDGKMQAMDESFYEGGYVNVRGYTEEIEVDEAWCFEGDCKKYQYVAFYILPSEYDNTALQKFIDSNGGNSYVGDESVGLGCNEDGIIVYENDSDEFGYENFELSADVSKAILDSHEQNPIDLQLVKKPLSGGRGAGTCYSHFTEIKLI